MSRTVPFSPRNFPQRGNTGDCITSLSGPRVPCAFLVLRLRLHPPVVARLWMYGHTGPYLYTFLLSKATLKGHATFGRIRGFAEEKWQHCISGGRHAKPLKSITRQPYM